MYPLQNCPVSFSHPRNALLYRDVSNSFPSTFGWLTTTPSTQFEVCWKRKEKSTEDTLLSAVYFIKACKDTNVSVPCMFLLGKANNKCAASFLLMCLIYFIPLALIFCLLERYLYIKYV